MTSPSYSSSISPTLRSSFSSLTQSTSPTVSLQMSAPIQHYAPTASTSSLSPDPTAQFTKAKKTRTRDGCLTCRSRKKRCDQQKPKCNGCSRLALDCQWEDKEKAAVERREKREQRKREKALQKKEEDTQPGAASGTMKARVEGTRNGGQDDLQGLEALATAGLISSMSGYSPPQTGKISHYSL